MKTSSGFRTILMLITLASVGVVTTYSTEPQFLRKEVVKKDSRGRPEVMKASAIGGVCMVEITYVYKWPQIHIVVVSSRGGIRNLGTLVLQNESEETLSGAALAEDFDLAFEYCLPLIVPGYTRA